ncbi:MAG: alpha/beta fold hydrolase [Paracoccaceae bacterium]
MSGEIVEGMIATSRLALYTLRNAHTGNRPRVLFLGGSNFDLRLKRAFLDTALVREFDFATYEPRGIGRSAQPKGAWSMADYAADALGLLDALGWDDAHILGESFGGMTALHLACAAPACVTRLVIASATAGGAEHRSYDISEYLNLSKEDAASASLRLQDSRNETLARDTPSAFAERLKDRLAFETQFATPSVVSGGYARLLEARRHHDCTAVGKINTPSLVIAGRYDRQAAPDAQKALSDALPNSAFQLYDAGHGVLFAEAEATKDMIEFLQCAHVVTAASSMAG